MQIREALEHLSKLEIISANDLSKLGRPFELAEIQKEGVFVPHSNDGGAWLHYMFPRELEQREQKYRQERLEAIRKEAGIAVQR